MKKLLIEFIGSPGTGKTTIASLVFAALKEESVNTEFVVEEARKYIAEKKYVAHKGFKGLSDLDQQEIIHRQILIEKYMVSSIERGVVVSDSSPLNGMLYLGDGISKVEVVESIKRFLETYQPLVFWCHSTSGFLEPDSNRIHSADQIAEVATKVPKVLLDFGVQPIELVGSVASRKNTVLRKIYDTLD
jgi:predicted ATPase